MSLTRRQFVGQAGASLGAVWAAGWKGAPGAVDARDVRYIIAALAPLDKAGRIDEGLTRDYLAYLSENGVDAVLVNGSTGEFASFSSAERRQNLEIFLRHKGRLDALCHVGKSNLPETLELLRHAQDSGADSVLVIPPYYYKGVGADGLAAFFRPVLDAATVPVLLYNIPQVSSVELSPELVERLKGHPRLAGIKDSWGKKEWTLDYIRRFPKLKIYTGASSLTETVLKEGGAGVISGNSNVFTRETASLFQAHRAGQDTAPAQQNLNRLAALFQGYPIIPAMKFVLAQRGLGPMAVRPPLQELGKSEQAALLARFKEAGVLPR